MKTTTQLTADFLAIALIILVVATVGYVGINSVNARLRDIYTERLLPAQYLANIRRGQVTVHRDLYRLVAEPSDRVAIDRELTETLRLVDENMALYNKTRLSREEWGREEREEAERGREEREEAERGREEREEAERLNAVWIDYRKAVAGARQRASHRGDQVLLRSISRGGSVFAAEQLLDSLVTDLLEAQAHRGVELKTAGDETFKRAVHTMGIVALIGVALAIVLGIVISRSITKPLAKISAVARDVAHGKLDPKPLSGITLNNEIGDLARTVTFMTDRLRETMDGLEAKNAELERFTYIVSHDLQSPLITIKGFAGYLEENAKAGNREQLQADSARVTQAADKMHRLLDELLTLSRIGRIVNPPEEVPFGDLAREAASLIAGQASGVEVEIASDLPVVHVDRTRLVEVLQNLMDNAVKFSRNQPEPRVEVGARNDGAETVFYVKDNGIGIEPRYQERVFGLFEQLNQSFEGTGVGLAIAKRVVEVHGGRIWVESEGAGRGSTFCFTLPTQQSATAKEA